MIIGTAELQRADGKSLQISRTWQTYFLVNYQLFRFYLLFSFIENIIENVTENICIFVYY